MRRRGGRRALAIIAIALVVSLGGAGPGLVREQLTAELTAAGFPDAQYVVEELSSGRAVLRDVHLPPDLVVDRVEIAFDPTTLLRDGRITDLALDGAVWTIPLEPGAVQRSAIARLASSSGGGGGGAIDRVRIARSHIEVAGRAPIAIEGELRPSAPSARLVVRSELGTHDILLAPRGDDALALEARPRAAGLALAVDTDRTLTALRWRVDGRAPRAWVTDALGAGGESGLALAADPGISASGTARRNDTAWTLEDVAASVHLAGASLDGAELEELRVWARGRGALDAIALDAVTVSAARIEAGDLRVDDVVVEGALDVALAGSDLRVTERAPLVVRAGATTLGSGPDRERLEGLAMELEGRDGPLATIDPAGVHLAARLRAEAPRARGVVAARTIRAHGTVSAEITSERSDVRGRIHAEAESLAHLDSDVVLTAPRVDLTLTTDARGRLRAVGRGRAEHAAWRSVPVGPTAAHVRVTRQELAIDAIGRATREAPFALAARIGLARDGGSVHLGVPMSEVRATDPLHRVLAELVGMRIVGRAGGQVDADLGTLGAGTARIAVEGASLEPTIGSGAARGVHGEIQLAQLEPATSVAFAPVRFLELDVGDLVTTGPGTARVRFAPDGQMEVEELTAVLGGGRVRLAPFRMDLDAPDTTVDVRLAGVDLADIATAISRGRVEATGEVDGRIALRVRLGEEMRIVLGEGHLTARPPGRIRVVGDVTPPADTRDPSRIAGALGRRVIAALSDFEYSRLSIDLVREGEATMAHASVTGCGTRTPQEIELALNVSGIQPLLDEVLRLWPSTPTGSIE